MVCKAAAKTLALVALVHASTCAEAFVASSQPWGLSPSTSAFRMSSVAGESAAENDAPPADAAADAAVSAVSEVSTTAPAAPDQKKKKKKPVAGSSAHAEGIFSPAVKASKVLLGEDRLIKIRAKVIGAHSGVIKDFVATSDSEVGQSVLNLLFSTMDKDGNGVLDREELTAGLKALGFTWLKDKQIDGILKRADANGDGVISIEEFCTEAPKTLKTNLVKLAKQNGSDLGFLV